jgi:hypothetical protein
MPIGVIVFYVSDVFLVKITLIVMFKVLTVVTINVTTLLWDVTLCIYLFIVIYKHYQWSMLYIFKW